MVILLKCLSIHGHYLELLTLINSMSALPIHHEADCLNSHVIVVEQEARGVK